MSGLEEVRYFLVQQMGLRNTDFDSKEQGDRNTGNFISIIWKMRPWKKYVFLKTKEFSHEILNQVFVQHT